jgi:hypothetical protein
MVGSSDSDEEESSNEVPLENRDPEGDKTTYGKIEDFLIVNTKKIDLGNTLPGQVKEEDLQIVYKDPIKKNYQLKVEVKVVCLSERFDELDEYVFGLRKPPMFDFNDTFIIKMDPENKIILRCAVKIPNVKEEMIIEGYIKMECPNLEGKIQIPVSASVQYPKSNQHRVAVLPEDSVRQRGGGRLLQPGEDLPAGDQAAAALPGHQQDLLRVLLPQRRGGHLLHLPAPQPRLHLPQDAPDPQHHRQTGLHPPRTTQQPRNQEDTRRQDTQHLHDVLVPTAL